jgi:hypothetical protein
VVDERGEALDGRAADRLCRLERTAPTEDGEVQQIVELVFVEEVDGPVERRSKGLLARRQVSRPSRQEW